jgi:hypothetical protein
MGAAARRAAVLAVTALMTLGAGRDASAGFQNHGLSRTSTNAVEEFALKLTGHGAGTTAPVFTTSGHSSLHLADVVAPLLNHAHVTGTGSGSVAAQFTHVPTPLVTYLPTSPTGQIVSPGGTSTDTTGGTGPVIYSISRPFVSVSDTSAPAPPDSPAVPEIDPGSIPGALTLLVGGTLVLASRRRP